MNAWKLLFYSLRYFHKVVHEDAVENTFHLGKMETILRE